MNVGREFVPKSELVRSYMPSIKITILDSFIPNKRMMVYFLVRHPRTSTPLSLKIDTKPTGAWDVKISYNNNKETHPIKILDILFGVPVDEALTLLNELVSELFQFLNYVGEYDVNKVMQDILPWADKCSNKPSASATA